MISAAEEWRARHPLGCFFPPRIHHTVHQMSKTEQYSKKMLFHRPNTRAERGCIWVGLLFKNVWF